MPIQRGTSRIQGSRKGRPPGNNGLVSFNERQASPRHLTRGLAHPNVAYRNENAAILTEESPSAELLASHSSTSVTTSMISTSGTSSPDTSATRWRSCVASASIVASAAPSSSGGPATCSFLTRSGWKAFRHRGHALGERFRRHLSAEGCAVH